MSPLKAIGDIPCSLADNLHVTLHGAPQHAVADVVLESLPSEELDNGLGGVQHVP
jgi:hypothetical protein